MPKVDKFNNHKLANLYLVKKKSTYAIARQLHCDPKTVWRHLITNYIPTRPRKVVPIDKLELNTLYSSGMSMSGIGHMYGICPAAVHRKLHTIENIKIRYSWEKNYKYLMYDFSSNNCEKAYLVGFRLGDLHVQIKTRSSPSIIVKSGTTKRAQLDLMTNLFSRYGHIWISGPHANGEYQFETRLNRSFDFLVSKQRVIPQWIIRDDNYFWNFVAGYIDAEGSIGVYANRAKFRVGSYDLEILREIDRKMRSIGLISLLRLDQKAGFHYGRNLNGDFWRITINNARSLCRLFLILNNKIRHRKRIYDMQIAKENLKLRGYWLVE